MRVPKTAKHSLEALPGVPVADGVVLAGGAGRRLGGRDKGLLMLGAHPLVVRAAAVLAPHCGQVWVSARARAAYAALGFAVLDDGPWAGAGPLAGMRAALCATTAPWLFALPCDVPLLPPDYGPRLLSAAAAAATPVVVAHDGERVHHACALLRRTLLADLDAYLALGGRRVEEFWAQVGSTPVDFSAQRACFANVNTAADLARVRSLWSETA